jgi:hypothetical protein
MLPSRITTTEQYGEGGQRIGKRAGSQPANIYKTQQQFRAYFREYPAASMKGEEVEEDN